MIVTKSSILSTFVYIWIPIMNFLFEKKKNHFSVFMLICLEWVAQLVRALSQYTKVSGLIPG